ncbi:hypothetical protein [Corynebacterium bovis]|uniref:hypothetical protein n=1 Tax=Corynebacterium bovis TaxID=36808 RepID=UPI0031388BF5
MVLIAVIAVVAVVVIVYIGARGGDSTTGSQGQDPAPSGSSESALQGAPSGGDVTSDFWGRRVVIPANPDGDVIPQNPVDTADACNPVNYSRVPADLTAQRTHTMSTLWSSTDGPTGFTDGIPSGYSHTPQGAALAGWNYLSLFFVGGKVGYSAARNFFGFSDEERREMESIPGGPDKDTTQDRTRMVAPAAVKYLSCHDDQVVVQYFLPIPDRSTGDSSRPRYGLIQTPVKWFGDHWELSMKKDTNPGGNVVESIDGEAVQWEY